MKILFEDGFAILKGTGIGQHTINLLYQLNTYSGIESVSLIEKPFLSKVPSAALRRILYIAWLNSRLQLMLKRERVDIIHFTNYLVPVLRLSNAKYVVTIHDLTAWKFPETLPPIYLPYIKWSISHAVKIADLIVTVSDAVKQEIAELFGLNIERIRTCYNGVARSFLESPRTAPDKIGAIKEKFGIKKDFLLFVGTIEKRKNVVTLVKAFDRVRNYKDLQLVLVGRPGYCFSMFNKYLNEHGLNGEVIMTGYVSEEEKIALYDGAAAFVYPSLYEGFGIPLVEAMARRVPIVASRIPSTEEIANKAALYYDDPFDYKTLANRILELLDSDTLRRDLMEKGVKRAQEFSWEKASKEHLRAYRELLGMDK
jgi:glycosyltransferase involved in cell wall biosynthesis